MLTNPQASGLWTDKRVRIRLMKSRALCVAVATFLAAIMASPAGAQGRGGIPVPALPDQPWEYQTANARIRVRVLTSGLENPWSLEFLPDASILITERNGRLRNFKDG
jgi:glucose/arabinose dehydrogenase